MTAQIKIIRGRCRVCSAIVSDRRTYCDEHRPRPAGPGHCAVCGRAIRRTATHCVAHRQGQGCVADLVICDLCPFLGSCLEAMHDPAPLPCQPASALYLQWCGLGYDRGARKRKETASERAIEYLS